MHLGDELKKPLRVSFYSAGAKEPAQVRAHVSAPQETRRRPAACLNGGLCRRRVGANHQQSLPGAAATGGRLLAPNAPGFPFPPPIRTALRAPDPAALPQDEGGVRKEFFQILVEQIFQTEYGRVCIQPASAFAVARTN
jgi:hypothetical protein